MKHIFNFSPILHVAIIHGMTLAPETKLSPI